MLVLGFPVASDSFGGIGIPAEWESRDAEANGRHVKRMVTMGGRVGNREDGKNSSGLLLRDFVYCFALESGVERERVNKNPKQLAQFI
jgi:hypothetical protein